MMKFLKSHEERVFYILICISITIPFGIKLNNLFILLLALNWLFSLRLKPNGRISLNLLLPLFFALNLIGLLYTSNLSQGMFALEKKISILLFPLVLLNAGCFSEKRLKVFLMTFAYACVFASLICFGFAFYKYYSASTTEYFFYHSLTEVVGVHAIYMAMYASFSVFILYYYWFYSSTQIKHRYLFFALASYLSVFIFLLSARLIITTYFLTILVFIVITAMKSKKYLLMSFVLFVVMAAAISLIIFIPSNLERFKEAINYQSLYTIDKQYGGRSTRELIWSCSLDVIRENILFGVGIGDSQDALQECYKKDESKNWALLYRPEFKYNAHNQYFQTAIDLGLVGLCVFIACLAIPASVAIKTRNYLFLAFIGLFSIACATESMLELNKGIVFFSFFSSLFLNRYDINAAWSTNVISSHYKDDR